MNESDMTLYHFSPCTINMATSHYMSSENGI